MPVKPSDHDTTGHTSGAPACDGFVVSLVTRESNFEVRGLGVSAGRVRQRAVASRARLLHVTIKPLGSLPGGLPLLAGCDLVRRSGMGWFRVLLASAPPPKKRPPVGGLTC
jgi:hypothetical protein